MVTCQASFGAVDPRGARCPPNNPSEAKGEFGAALSDEDRVNIPVAIGTINVGSRLAIGFQSQHAVGTGRNSPGTEYARRRRQKLKETPRLMALVNILVFSVSLLSIETLFTKE